MKNNNKKDKIDVCLVFILIIALGTVLYSVLTFGQSCIHSDVATATLLAQSQIKHMALFPSGWTYGNGDVWVVAINIFTLPFTLLVHDQSLARMLGSALLIVLSSVTIYLFNTYMLKSRGWLFSIPFSLIFLVGSYDFVLYQACYTGQIIWMLLSVWFTYEMLYGKKKIKFLVLYSIVTFVTVLGGMRAVAVQTVPLIASVAVKLYLEKSEKKENELIVSGIKKISMIMPAVLVGVIGYKYICLKHNVVQNANSSMVFVNSFDDVCKLFSAYFRSLFDCFGYVGRTSISDIWGVRNLVLVMSCVLIIFIVPFLQFKKWKNETDETVFFIVFSAAHIAEMFLLFVLFGKSEARYLLTSVFLLEMISGRYIYENWLRRVYLDKVLITGLYAVAVMILALSITFPNRAWRSVLSEKKEVCKELVDKGLVKGYASYWNAYNNAVYSDLKLDMGGVRIGSKGIEAYKWLVDDSVFEPKDGEKSFLLLDKNESKKMTSKRLEEFFGPTRDAFIVKEYSVYVWDYDISEKFVDDIGVELSSGFH